MSIKNTHEAGFLDFITGKGKPYIAEGKEKEFEEFKNKVFLLYKKINNAYKIYFQGAILKSDQERVKYREETYIDKSGKRRKKKIFIPQPKTRQIEFMGNWSFKLDKEKTSLGQAIHALYAFLQKVSNIHPEIKKKSILPKIEKEKPKEPKKETQKSPSVSLPE